MEAQAHGVPPGFLTMPDVEAHLGVARNVTGSLLVSYLPLVKSEDYALWEQYSVSKQGWIREANQNASAIPDPIYPHIWSTSAEDRRSLQSSQCSSLGRRLETDMERIDRKPDQGPFAPVWTFSPPPPPHDSSIINFDMIEKPVFKKAVNFIQYTRKPVFLDVCTQTKWFGESAPDRENDPQTVVVYPVFADVVPGAEIVGHLVAVIPWNVFFEKILSADTTPITVVLENTCNEVFSYSVEGSDAIFLAEEDAHETKFNSYVVQDIFADFANPKELRDQGIGEHCVYTISVYPTTATIDAHISFQPVLYTAVVVAIFFFTSLVFILYDVFVKRRQDKLLANAARTNEIVSVSVAN